jgi:hypothetical protein
VTRGAEFSRYHGSIDNPATHAKATSTTLGESNTIKIHKGYWDKKTIRLSTSRLRLGELR